MDLPGGIQEYPVWFLDGFLSLSWLGYISFGEVTPGGWTDGDGIINCVKQSYDVESENFAVSLLKHEAQHAMDISRYGKLPSEVLEYRAKLVELIYSSERNLLRRFIYEASDSQPCNGHSRAASRITAEFRKRMKGQKLEELTIGEIRRTAAALFRESDADLREQYP